ncbi:hypothetical protein BLA60_06580 [Actinophytocola xinjiangensis]|uniref:Uncharacterized protein n=1 Tax=Actinophytocola xinjiangensis TaxID=485602 RepID=A0A7Z0WQ67_9PSEU|nr:hypothetical protein [Actinophytocola xinjiangensis]OLF12914.1 hypothetical protein BLA60_06580 [Actinophytocola xinjiangensis]
MAKQRLSEDVQRQPHADPTPRRRPRPGDRLRQAVDTVLVELAADGNPDGPARHRLDDLLVSGLAWAAATGDTCRIEHAVHAVRDARTHLADADPDGARTALLTAREDLAPPVAR